MGILDLFSLKGKNALVTGSGQGLGSGMAIAFAQAGANVTLHSYDKVLDSTIEEIKKTGVKFISRSGDVCDQAVGHMLVDDTIKEFGSIDILVNNAGTIRRAPRRRALRSVLEHRHRHQPQLRFGSSASTRATRCWRQGHGKIINTCSLLSFQGGINVPGYAAAKGAVAQLTKALANEWTAKASTSTPSLPATWPRTTPRLCGRCRSLQGDSGPDSRRTLGPAFGFGRHGGLSCLRCEQLCQRPHSGRRRRMALPLGL